MWGSRCNLSLEGLAVSSGSQLPECIGAEGV